MSNGCPFCRPDANRVFFESPLVFGLWDGFPVSPGHALVIPRRHVASWFDATEEEQAALLEGIRRAREAICRAHQPDGFNIGINVHEAAGQTVFHLHVHVIPRFRGDVPNPRGGVRHVIPAKADYVVPECESEKRLMLHPHESALVRGGDDLLRPHLLADLGRAEAVDIAVAFVVRSGVWLVEEHFRDLLARGGRIRFLTGDYLDVTEPEALRQLLDLDLDGRLELRVFEARQRSFHPKAFIFHFSDGSGTAYVGSSNLTRTALQERGVEWNYRVVTTQDNAGFNDIRDAFESLYRHPETRLLDEVWIRAYEQRRPVRPNLVELAVYREPLPPVPVPHAVQCEALAKLEETRRAGNTAGLVVLATGLGKTWLSAFDSARPEFGKVLFVAHREEILGQAIKTFRRVRPGAVLGRYDGSNREPDADLVFASVQTLGQARHLDRFARDRFDYIIVDEFHHAAARTYRNLIDYFEPKFLLGLTATPERTDGGDLLALCQENMVFGCDAFHGIEQGLLCPFRYFGVPDEVDYSNIPWRNSRFDEEALTTALATQARAENALGQHRKLAGKRTLAFCCSRRHADFMSDYFKNQGVRCVAVHSGPSSFSRAHALELLCAGELDVVFAVDMFNEGVDVPNIDTVLMLRPTESGIIWQQQFGRGLRKSEGKAHLTVIDYIGNHRIFLTKVRTLWGLDLGDQRIDEILNLWAKGEGHLPPGCEVTYELRAVGIIRSLLRPRTSVDAFKAYYEEFKQRRGVRPTAVEAFHDHYTPKSLRSQYGSWHRFVESMGDLTNEQSAALKDYGTFLDSLELTPMTKSYKMLVLLAMLNEDQFPGELAIDKLAKAFRRLARRSAILAQDVGPALDSDTELQRHNEQNPIAAWSGGRGTGNRTYFAYENRTFRSTFALKEEHRAACQELARELVDWRLAEYMSRVKAAASGTDGARRIECKVSHSGGNPMLFLPDRRRHPGIPSGWTKVITEHGDYEANFVQIAVNVIRKPGDTSNLLPDLMRVWFGPDAGRPGTNFNVVFEQEDEGWRMSPSEDAETVV